MMALSICDSRTNENRRELADHGTAFFPIACYNDDLSCEEVPWHWHDEIEAVIVTEGAALVSVGSEKFTAGKGEGFFINSGVLHAMKNADGGSCRFHSMVFHARLVGGGMDSVYWQKYVLPLTDSSGFTYKRFDGGEEWHERALSAIEGAWQSCADEREGYEFAVRAELSQLIFLLSKVCSAQRRRLASSELSNNNRIILMLQYIQENYAQKLELAQIARSASISQSECLRCFKSTIGASPINYVNQYRVQKAAELLSAAELKSGDVGAVCGFSDASYFVRVFRKIKGCTPMEYRQKVAQGSDIRQ